MEHIGALLVDKPAGMTSHDVVAKLRRVFKQKRIGHTGTLDPFATGLLILCLGRATRLTQFLSKETKEYEAVLRLGFATDTQDYTGEPTTPLVSAKHFTARDLQQALSKFVGPQLQLPPMFSAKKVAGRALYKHARRGEVIARAAVPIVVYQIELTRVHMNRDFPDTQDVTISVTCSSGTYIRTLAHDIGEYLGCGAHLVQLRRTKIGEFSLVQAIPLSELLDMATQTDLMAKLLPPVDLLVKLPAVTLTETEVLQVKRGQAIPIEKNENDWIKLLAANGTLVVLAQVIEKESGQWLQPKILLI